MRQSRRGCEGGGAREQLNGHNDLFSYTQDLLDAANGLFLLEPPVFYVFGFLHRTLIRREALAGCSASLTVHLHGCAIWFGESWNYFYQ